MKKTMALYAEEGSAQHVVAHAMHRCKRGRKPSLPYAGIKNPQKALKLAQEVLTLGNETRTISKEEYRELFDRLPINNPTAKDMAMMCPHLTPEQAVKAFYDFGNSGYVALPPLRIRHAHQTISLVKGFTVESFKWVGNKKVVTGGKKYPPRLTYSHASRTPASYADGKKHGAASSTTLYMNEAMAYAEKNWGADLILDNWIDYVTVVIQDPSILISSKFRKDSPKTIAILALTLTKGVNSFNDDHSHPVSELYDEYIAEMTTDYVVASELKGGRGGFTHYNCAYCGSGLGLSGCRGCGHKFRDDQSRCGWSTPLSRRQVAHLQGQGHVFKQDPEIAFQKEKDDHGKYLIMCAEAEKRRNNIQAA